MDWLTLLAWAKKKHSTTEWRQLKPLKESWKIQVECWFLPKYLYFRPRIAVKNQSENLVKSAGVKNIGNLVKTLRVKNKT